MNEQEIKKLADLVYENFTKYDIDKSGFLDKQETIKVLEFLDNQIDEGKISGTQGDDAFFSLRDGFEDKKISFGEFWVAIVEKSGYLG